MRRLLTRPLCVIAALLMLIGTGCGGGGGSDAPTVSVGGAGGGGGGTPTGNRACMQCHNATPSDYFTPGDGFEPRAPYPEAGQGIGPAFDSSVHYSPPSMPNATDYVKCEDCHGNGSQHFGVGPIAIWAPQYAQCINCHNAGTGFDVTAFEATTHPNLNLTPDAFFFQGGAGNDQATSQGQGLFMADGTTPVTKDERIQECSVCHNYEIEARPKHIANQLTEPRVDCQQCHDAHMPALRELPNIGTRTVAQSNPVLRLKPQRVNNNPAGADFGAKNATSGTWIRPANAFFYMIAGQPTDPGFATQATVQGDLLRLSTERLCASCHTQGLYKYSRFEGTTPYGPTHNEDIFTQYLKSGHGNPNANPFAEFSLLAAVGGSHRPQYPVDMGLTDGRVNGGANNYTCNQCHHGLGAIDYLKGVQGGVEFGDSNEAHVLFGDSTVTCLTCHDPHENGNGQNVRVPVYLSFSRWFNDVNNPGAGNVRGGLNRMLDGTDIPAATANQPVLVCLSCHQGRESGYTLYRNLLAGGGDAYNPAAPYAGGYTNAHYYSGGSELWSKNSFEFFFAGTPQDYSNGVPQHQTLNCNGCHMSDIDPNLGGHSMQPSVLTCRTSGCHPGMPSIPIWPGPQNVDGDLSTILVTDQFGTINRLTAPAITDQGLFNILRYVFYANHNIEYDPDVYPYFFVRINPYNVANHTNANRVNNWTSAQIEAAFNLGKLYKEGTAVYVHNYYYSSQIMIDSLRALGVTANPNTAINFERPVTPPGGTTRPATDYRTIVIP